MLSTCLGRRHHHLTLCSPPDISLPSVVSAESPPGHQGQRVALLTPPVEAPPRDGGGVGEGNPRGWLRQGCQGKEAPGLPQSSGEPGKVGLPRGPQGALLASAEASTTSCSPRAPPSLRVSPLPRERSQLLGGPTGCFQLQITSARAPVSAGQRLSWK